MSFTFYAVNSVKYNSAASNRINQHIFLGYICMINTSGFFEKKRWKNSKYIS